MSAKSRERGNARFFFIIGIFFLGFLAIAIRLVNVQAVEREKYENLAKNQRLKSIEIPAKRGDIVDRNGNLLATSMDAITIYANPYFIKDPENVASQLSSILGINKKTILEKIDKDSGFVYIARKVDQSVVKRVKALKIEGIGFLNESKRCYPYNELASHVVGFVGIDNDGLVGLEMFYDDVLRGLPGHLLVEKDPIGRSISTGIFELSPSVDGKDIVLTIDRAIQFKAEEELNSCIDKFNAKAGNIVVMRPDTGEILAIANYPSFDLNNYTQTDSECFRNRAITDLFEPGSTIKAIIGAAALEERVAKPMDFFRLPDSIEVADKVIKESHKRPTEDFTFTKIITESSNVGAVVVGQKLGKKRIYDYLTAFGFNKKTGIDFPGEGQGYVPPPEKWSGSTIGNIPFGQGMSVTSLQMLQSFSTIANDGLLVKPYFLSKIIDSDGKIIKEVAPQQGEKVLSSKSAEQMKLILEKVVTEGTGENAQISGYRVAGKTGTAQKAKENGNGYEAGKYVSSFIGFAPVEEPRLAIIVVIDEPKTTFYGATVAAPVFKNLAEFSLRYLKIPPGEE
ncbi:penicillin-binding protein 2 [Candidatus Oleimmundimicrobium sp.]|uniref:peptidoglycan D,D-transpeptidase FtsI family protein n=1 Tax=Candidatus Oleimmundimicrobium sp. TaxID=3060597 RepID=UPI00272289E8|nr:penicillin-binding protein 2 [Candidatus Oleimmundimicrobium sp.]MDO8885503.1 penicillin-binding protein 2 [Candidatus Oleimmundimicrobium sp.]